MSSEILSVLEYMEKEKGIPRADMISTIINAIKTAALKGVNSGQEIKIEISPKNGQLKAWSVLKVVDSVALAVWVDDGGWKCIAVHSTPAGK